MEGADGRERCHNEAEALRLHLRYARTHDPDTLSADGAVDELNQRLGHTPGLDEVAAALGADGDTLDQTTAAMAARRLRSLEAPSVTTERSRRVAGEDDRIAGGSDRSAFREAVAELSERDRRLLFEYFISGHTQSQIAADYDMSEMQVARWITAALRSFRELLK